MRRDKAEGGYSGFITRINQSINHSVSLGKMVLYVDAVSLFYDLLHCSWGSSGGSM